MSVNMDKTLVSDMGLLSQLSYLLFGDSPLVKGETFNVFVDDGIIYTLNSSYTVIDYTPTTITMPDSSFDMQALLLAKNDNAGNPTGEYVIAFRGTEPNSDRDWISNGLTGLANFNPQAIAGKAFVQEMMAKHSIATNKLTLTGHSLGGIITQAVGADLHIQGYSFNPYGANLLSSLPPMPLS
jgi:hypothetical protein